MAPTSAYPRSFPLICTNGRLRQPSTPPNFVIQESNSPMPGALEPVEDIGASRVVDLIEGVCVRFLDGHGIAENQTGEGSHAQPWATELQAQGSHPIPSQHPPPPPSALSIPTAMTHSLTNLGPLLIFWNSSVHPTDNDYRRLLFYFEWFQKTESVSIKALGSDPEGFNSTCTEMALRYNFVK